MTTAIREALDLSALVLPEQPAVDRIEVEDYVDSSGEPSLKVLVVISEETELEKVSGSDVADLKFAIHQSLRAHGIAQFPYIFLAKPSELIDAETVE